MRYFSGMCPTSSNVRLLLCGGRAAVPGFATARSPKGSHASAHPHFARPQYCALLYRAGKTSSNLSVIRHWGDKIMLEDLFELLKDLLMFLSELRPWKPDVRKLY